jgi:hypothetical protein
VQSFYSESRLLSNAKMRSELGVVLAYPTYRQGLPAQLRQEQQRQRRQEARQRQRHGGADAPLTAASRTAEAPGGAPAAPPSPPPPQEGLLLLVDNGSVRAAATLSLRRSPHSWRPPSPPWRAARWLG